MVRVTGRIQIQLRGQELETHLHEKELFLNEKGLGNTCLFKERRKEGRKAREKKTDQCVNKEEKRIKS